MAPRPSTSAWRRGLVLLAIGAVFTAVVVYAVLWLSERAVADLHGVSRVAAERSARLASLGADDVLRDAVTAAPLSRARRRALDRSLKVAGDPGEQQLRLWARDGRLVYDSRPAASEARAGTHRSHALMAIRRGRSHSFVHRHDGERTTHVYVPIAAEPPSDEIVGAYELDLRNGPVTRAVDEAAGALRSDLWIAGAGLWLLLLPITVPAARALADRWQPGARRLLRDFRRAMAAGDLVVLYQPQVSVGTGRLAAAEALVRWRRHGGLVPPGAFLPAVEASSCIGPMTDYVLAAALEQAARWRDAGRVIPVAVNLSPALLRDGDLPRRIEAALARAGVPAEMLVVEVTETAVIEDDAAAADILAAIADLGVGVSVDDFGTGYSSLAWLVHFDIDEVKIDRSFVSDIRNQRRPVLETTVQMARSLGLRVVAEGVEDEATLSLLQEFGCDNVQGYLFAPPLPGSELLTWRPRDERSASNVRAILARLRDRLGVDAAFVVAFSDDEQLLRVLEGEAEVPERIPLADTYCHQMARGVFPNVVRDTRGWPPTRDMPITERIGVGAYIGVPIYDGDGSLYGALACVSATARSDFGDAQLREVQAAAARLTPHLHRARAAEQEEPERAASYERGSNR